MEKSPCKHTGEIVVDGSLRNLTTRSLLGFNCSLLTHSCKNNDVGVLFFIGEKFVNLVTNFSIRNLDIILSLTIVSHQGKEAIVGNVEQLVFLANDIGNVHIVGGGAEFFEFLAGEDIDSNQMNLCVTVLSSLGSRHIDDLAGAVFDHYETVLSQGRALHGKGGGGARIGGVEGVFMLSIVRHLD